MPNSIPIETLSTSLQSLKVDLSNLAEAWVAKPVLTTQLLQSTIIRPVEFDSLLEVSVLATVAGRGTERGRPRAEMTVPVTLLPEVLDTTWYEEPKDPSKRSWLARHKLATQEVTGGPRYLVRLFQRDGRWRLELSLVVLAATELGPLPAEANGLSHRLSALLRWEGAGVVRELPFTERLDNPNQSITLALSVDNLPMRDELYRALTDPASRASLLLVRDVRVAVKVTDPAPATAPVVAPSRQVKAIPKTNAGLTLGRKFAISKAEIVAGNIQAMQASFFKLERLALFKPLLATPEIEIQQGEIFDSNGELWIRYTVRVKNLEAYTDDLFAPSPDLPPCGLNTNASRTWVEIYDQNNQRIYGFCALGRAASLQSLWFAVPAHARPTGVSIELHDRRQQTLARSPVVGLPGLDLFEEVDRSLPEQIPLLFHPQVHGYIFQDFVRSTTAVRGLIPFVETFAEKAHRYFQDELNPSQFYYLPDCFRLQREGEAPHRPALVLESLDPERVRLSFIAAPVTDLDRLDRSRGDLQSRLRADADRVRLLPIQPSQVEFVPFNPALFRDAQVQVLNLNQLRVSVSLNSDQFSNLWSELLGGQTTDLGGKLRAEVAGFEAAEIPVFVRLDETVGECLRPSFEIDQERGGYLVRLTNAIESPLQLSGLSPFVQSKRLDLSDVRQAVWQDLNLPTGSLAPGAEVTGLLKPVGALRLEEFVPLIDTDGVRAIPDPDRIAASLLVGPSKTFNREVTVRLPASVFEEGPAERRIAVQVDFINGDSVLFEPPPNPTSGLISKQAKVRYPLIDQLLGKTAGGYHYSVQTVFAHGRIEKSAPLTADLDVVLIGLS
jgi:hypothetical protein